jgi:hypothetical protein
VTEAELAAHLDLDDGVADQALVVSVVGVEPPDAAGSPVCIVLAVSVLALEEAAEVPSLARLERG